MDYDPTVTGTHSSSMLYSLWLEGLRGHSWRTQAQIPLQSCDAPADCETHAGTKSDSGSSRYSGVERDDHSADARQYGDHHGYE